MRATAVGLSVSIASAALGQCAPEIVAEVQTIGDVGGIALDERGYLFVLDEGRGLVAFDIRDPSDPVAVGGFGWLYQPYYQLELAGRYLFAFHDDGFQWAQLSMLDVENPRSISYVDHLTHFCCEIGVAGDRLFVTYGRSTGYYEIGSGAFDIGESGPRLRESAYRISAQDLMMYATTLEGVVPIDFADPAGPRRYDPIVLGDWRGASHPEGSVLHVATADGPFATVDVRVLAGPQILDQMDLAAVDLDVADGVAVLAGSEVSVVDVSNPRALRLVGSLGLPTEPVEVAIRKGVAFVATQRDVYVIDYAGCLPCLPDIDRSGVLDLFDFLEFQRLFSAGDVRGDFDGDGSLTVYDFVAFQNAFQAGC
ncbi:MAG: GC-type dockerin domain-anchored protein [Phycisphaerales bacterium]|jgi:hypothetical protein